MFNDSIYYVIYDLNSKTLTSRRGFRNPLLPSQFAEPITVVPHCNGIDYWLICRPYFSAPNPDRGYSLLITEAGPSKIDKVVISTGMAEVYIGQLKTNKKGNKLIHGSTNSESNLGYFYDFNSTTGKISNKLPFGVGVISPIMGFRYGAIFSPNDSLAYVVNYGSTSNSFVYQINVSTLAIVNSFSVPIGSNLSGMALGPDNNIYISHYGVSDRQLGKIINPNSITSAAYIYAGLTFPSWPSLINPYVGGHCNFIDADPKPEIANDYMYTQTTCNTFKFIVDSCWQVYNVNWNFGDGTTGTGLVANHTYSTTGSFTVKMTLSLGTYSLNTVIKNITVLSSTTAITGPTVICKGSPFLNNYGVSSIPGATYNWGIVNGSISGPTNLSNVNVGATTTGIATVSVQIVSGGCISVGTKTLVIDTVPSVTIGSYQPICVGDLVNLTGAPSGGVFGGTGVLGSVFNSSVTGIGNQTVYYTITNSNGCSNTASRVIVVNACVGIEESELSNAGIQIYPNPNSGEFTITSTSELKDGKIEIYNSMGQLIKQDSLLQKLKVNISNYSKGVYFIRVFENNYNYYSYKILFY